MSGILTSDQVNYLIWRYLQECGYKYSIFAFEHETKAQLLHERYAEIKQGSLIGLIQRGLQYRELELQLNKDGTRKENPVIEPLFPHQPDTMKGLTRFPSVGNGHMDLDEDEEEKGSNSTTAQPASRKHGREDGINGVSSGGEKSVIREKKRRRKTTSTATPVALSGQNDVVKGEEVAAESIAGSSPPIVEEIRPITNGCSIGIQVETVTEISPASALILSGEPKSTSADWNPIDPATIATAGSGALPYVWKIPEDSDPQLVIPSYTLNHSSLKSKPHKVTAIRWSPCGQLLATGSLDGSANIWNEGGEPRYTFISRQTPVLGLKWNPSSSILLTVHCDDSIISWDITTGKLLFDFASRDCNIQDVTWVGDRKFVAGNSDGSVVVYAADTGEIVEKLTGDVKIPQKIAWDKTSDRLAVGSSDGRIAVWKNSSAQLPENIVNAHSGEVSHLYWQPTSTESLSRLPEVDPTTKTTRLLASASPADPVIKVWAFDDSSAAPVLLHSLSILQYSFSNISFSPDGLYIIAGAYRKLFVWRMEDAFLTYVYNASPEEKPLDGTTNGVKEPSADSQANGDMEIGGMEDNDSGNGDMEAYEVTDICWDKTSKKVAVAMSGVGCVIIPIAGKRRVVTEGNTPVPTINGVEEAISPKEVDKPSS